jgi:hypothetical protein
MSMRYFVLTLIVVFGVSSSRAHGQSNLCVKYLSPTGLAALKHWTESARLEKGLDDEIRSRVSKLEALKKWMQEEDLRLTYAPYVVRPPPVDPKILEMIAELRKSRMPRARELPRELVDALRKNPPEDITDYFKILEASPFEIRNSSEWTAINRYSERFKFDAGQLLDYEELMMKKLNKAEFIPNRDQIFEIYSNIPFDREYTRVSAAPKSHALRNGELTKPNQIALFDAYFLVTVEEGEIARLQEALTEARIQKGWRRIEADLIRKKVITETTAVSGVPYGDLHSEVAGAYVTIVQRLGSAFGPYVAHAGVINRPEAFIRDALPLIESGKNPSEVWRALSEREVTLYRKLGGDEDVVRRISENGMRSAFLRSGGTEDELRTRLLTDGLDSVIRDHIGEGKVAESPMISSTLNSDSLLAYAIAESYSVPKGAPIQEFAMTVPIYDVVVARRLDDVKNFEFLVWGKVSPRNVSRIGTEVPGKPTMAFEIKHEMENTPALPDFLVEPAP